MKYRIRFGEEYQDEIFDTEEEAEEHALYLAGAMRYGAEILHMSNPGDYDEDDYDDSFQIEEIDD